MRPSRPSRIVAAFIALISILFMQFAVASYACPGLAQAEETASAPLTMSGHGLSACHHVEMEQPGLCHAHIQAVKQPLDKPELPHVQPFVAVRLARLLSPVDVIYSPPATPVETVQLARATAPPLAIRNCCFRI